MELEYNVTTEDIIAFNLYHFRNSPALQRQALIARLFLSGVVIVLTLALTYFLVGDHHLSLFSFIAATIAGMFFFFIHPRFVEPNLKKQVQKMLSEGKNDGIIGKRKLTLTPAAIIDETSAGEQKAFWSSVNKIVETSDHIFIYLSAVSAEIIPHKVFSNEAQRIAFLQLAQQYHRAATA